MGLDKQPHKPECSGTLLLLQGLVAGEQGGLQGREGTLGPPWGMGLKAQTGMFRKGTKMSGLNPAGEGEVCAETHYLRNRDVFCVVSLPFWCANFSWGL